MFISNYHTHTQLCKHANGMPADYVKQAQNDGCSVLGFSDHCPYPENNKNNWDHCRMSVSELKLYKSAVETAASNARIPVYFGFECEWDADYKAWYEDVLKGENKADYLVFGAHWVALGNDHIYIKDCAMDSIMLHKYIDQMVCGMQSGLYAFVAHPDLFMAGRGVWDSEAEACSKAIISAAKDLNLPLEINGYGIVKESVLLPSGSRHQYPVRDFWLLAIEAGVKIICNSDAHDPSVVVENALKARKFATDLGITPVEKLSCLD